MPTLAPTARPPKTCRLLTAEEFLDWLQPKIYADLISGQKFMHSPVNFRHATILNFVDRVLALYVARQRLGRLDRENIAVRFGPRDVFMPDLCFFTNEQVARLLPGYAPFAPALVAEALSPSTGQRDLGIKFAAYERYGVQEYWVLDPQHLTHRFFAREGELLVEFGMDAERIDSRVIPGFYLRRVWLDPVAPPDVETCFHEIIAAA